MEQPSDSVSSSSSVAARYKKSQGENLPPVSTAAVQTTTGKYCVGYDKQNITDNACVLETKPNKIYEGKDIELIEWAEDGFASETQSSSAIYGEMMKSQPSDRWNSSIRRSPLCFKITESYPFIVVSFIVILLNTVSISAEANNQVYKCVNGHDSDHGVNMDIVKISNWLCFAALLIETLIRMLGSPHSPIWYDGWLVFDICVACGGVADLVYDLGRDTDADDMGCSSNSMIFTTFRVARSLRSARLFRVLRYIRPLRIVATMFGSSVVQCGWMLLLVLVVNSLGAVAFTATIGLLPSRTDVVEADAHDISVDFGDFGSSLFTLSAIILRGVRWGAFVHPMLRSGEANRVLCGILITLFVGFSLLCLANLITGTFVSRLLRAGLKDAALLDRESLVAGHKRLNQQMEAFMRLDNSGDGHINMHDFRTALKSGQLSALSVTGVSHDELLRLFKSLHINENARGVSIAEFLLAIMKVRDRKVADTLSMEYQQQKTNTELKRVGMTFASDVHIMNMFTNEIGGRLEKLGASMNEMFRVIEESAPTRQRSYAQNSNRVGGEESAKTEAKSAQAELVVDGIEDHPLRGHHAEQVLSDLERRFGFWTRLLAVEEKFREIERRASTEDVTTDTQTDGETATSGEDPFNLANCLKSATLPASGSLALREILFEEVVPWLQREVAMVCPSSEFPSNRPAPQVTLDEKSDLPHRLTSQAPKAGNP
eukprot:TRINITY_DN4981_c0_g1_i5.p1 TRINITY_DN4981_c0_g1~~TRINITY_DN4981_c0_g1_i5.p1  ORF type:complete len:715 (-),score=82.47 TRINITY_DN4981_c0_g1_i5:230-2374(-)